MSQHYTKNTIQAESWCKTCGRATPHHVSDGKPSTASPAPSSA